MNIKVIGVKIDEALYEEIRKYNISNSRFLRNAILYYMIDHEPKKVNLVNPQLTDDNSKLEEMVKINYENE